MKTLRTCIPCIFLFIALFYLVSQSSAQPTSREVWGDIISNTTWSHDTIKIIGDVTVADNVSLTIRQGEFSLCLVIPDAVKPPRPVQHAVGEQHWRYGAR